MEENDMYIRIREELKCLGGFFLLVTILICIGLYIAYHHIPVR